MSPLWCKELLLSDTTVEFYASPVTELTKTSGRKVADHDSAKYHCDPDDLVNIQDLVVDQRSDGGRHYGFDRGDDGSAAIIDTLQSAGIEKIGKDCGENAVEHDQTGLRRRTCQSPSDIFQRNERFNN